MWRDTIKMDSLAMVMIILSRTWDGRLSPEISFCRIQLKLFSGMFWWMVGDQKESDREQHKLRVMWYNRYNIVQNNIGHCRMIFLVSGELYGEEGIK